jgi:GTPase SAR1 family protein
MAAIRVFLCGGPNSGKTVFLSALFKSLFVADQKIGLRCETTAIARAILSKIYNNLGKSFPRGTELSEQHEIHFPFILITSETNPFSPQR